MSKPRTGKFKKIIALVVNLQMVATTSAFANDSGNGWDTVQQVTSVVGGVANQAMQQMQQMQMQQMQMQQKMMMQQTLGLKMVDPSQVPKILTDNMCAVLEAKGTLPADRCEQIDPQKAQTGYYQALIDVSHNNANDLENFLTPGHERFTAQGIGCYDKALKQFTAALNARVEALTKLEASLERELENFDLMTKQEVDGIKKYAAELTGQPASLIKDKVFEKEFGDSQCQSFISPETFKSTGKKGYQGIKDFLSSTVDSPKKGMTPSQLKGRQRDIKKEVQAIAKQIGEFAAKKKTLDVNAGALGIKSKYIGTDNNALKAIIASTSTQAKNELLDLQKEVAKYGGKEAETIMQGVMNDSIDLENELFVYERKNKNECFNKYMASNFGGAQGLAAKLEDPNISVKANKEADNAFKNAIVSILGDDDYTMEQKVKRIQEEENKTGNNIYTFMTGKSVNIKGKQIGASTRLRASDMISIFADNCTEKFEKQSTSKGQSERFVMNSLKSFKTKFTALRNKFVTKVQENIISDMLNCPSETTTGVGASSCEGALDSNAPSFCLRTANLCASNMLACKDKAEKIFENKRNEQKKLAQSYNAKFANYKMAITNAFKATNAIMEQTARNLDGMYQLGSIYQTPVGLDLNVVAKEFLGDEKKGFDASLEMEDPKALLTTMKKNIAELKKNVKEANDEILNGPKNSKDRSLASGGGDANKYKGFVGELQKYQDNYKKQKDEWKALKQACQTAIQNYNQMVADNNSKRAEENAKKNRLCGQVYSFTQNPAGFCGEAAALGDEILEVAAVAGDYSAAADLKAFDQTCNSFNAEDGSNSYDSFGSDGSRAPASMTVEQYCDKYSHSACDTYKSADVEICSKDEDADSRLQKYAEENASQYCVVDLGASLKLIDSDTTVCPSTYKIGSTEYIPVLFDSTKEKHRNLLKEEGEKLRELCLLPGEIEKDKKIGPAYKKIKELIAQQQRAELYDAYGDVSVSSCNSTFDSFVGKEPTGTITSSRSLAGDESAGVLSD